MLSSACKCHKQWWHRAADLRDYHQPRQSSHLQQTKREIVLTFNPKLLFFSRNKQIQTQITKHKPEISIGSAMQSMFDAFLSMDSTAARSLLSTYSTSGLFKESQVDIDSSIDTEKESDLSGDIFKLLHETAATALGMATSLLVEDEDLPTGTAFCFTGGRNTPVKLAFVETEGPFFMLTILVVHGTYICQNSIK